MESAWREVERLIDANATHRSGFRLQDVKSKFILQQAKRELKELKDEPEDIDELADLFGVLIHYAIKKGWSQEQLEMRLLVKLAKRFEIEPILEEGEIC